MTPPEFDTARLHLRPLRQSDAGAMFSMMSDEETMLFWDWPAFRDRATVEEVVEGQIADMEAGRSMYWAVLAEGVFVGCCDLSEIDEHHGRAEVGFIFARSSWGRGYAQEAMSAIVNFAFGPLGLERLWARFHAGNDRSRVLLEGLGFIYEGCLHGHVRRDGERRDCILYGRVRG